MTEQSVPALPELLDELELDELVLDEELLLELELSSPLTVTFDGQTPPGLAVKPNVIEPPGGMLAL